MLGSTCLRPIVTQYFAPQVNIEAFPSRGRISSLHHDGCGVFTNIKSLQYSILMTDHPYSCLGWSDVDLNVDLPALRMLVIAQILPDSLPNSGLRYLADVIPCSWCLATNYSSSAGNTVVSPAEACRYNAAIGPGNLLRPGPPPAPAINPGSVHWWKPSFYAELAAAKTAKGRMLPPA